MSDCDEHVKRLTLNSAVDPEFPDRVVEVRSCATSSVGFSISGPGPGE